MFVYYIYVCVLMVRTRYNTMVTRRCTKKCSNHKYVPLNQMELHDMCVKDIYAYIRAYGSRRKNILLANLHPYAKRHDLCKIYIMNM
jgi:hypothetical protein